MKAHLQLQSPEGICDVWVWAASHGKDWIPAEPQCYVAAAHAKASVEEQPKQGQMSWNSLFESLATSTESSEELCIKLAQALC